MMKRQICILLFSLGFFQTAKAHADSIGLRPACVGVEPYQEDETRPLSFEILRSMICSESLESPDQVLDYFNRSAKLKKYGSNPVLIRSSQALHTRDVRPDFPRIILATEQMILQFTGDLERSSAQFIEIFEYLPKEHRFRFPLINFNALGSAELFIEDASFIDFTKLSQPEAFSGVSPCSTCHYSSRSTYSPNLAPRWTPYPISMPAYGRLADQIKLGSTEHEQWLDFERKLDSSAAQRYRRVLLSSRQEIDGNLRFIDRPNRHLSQTLNHMKADRLAFAMTSHPTWPKLKFAIAGGLASCSEIASFLPDSYRNLHEAEFLSRLREALPVESKNWLALDRLIADRLPSDARRQGNEVYLSLDKFVAASSLSLEDTLGEWTRTSSESNLEYLYRMFPEPFQKPGPEIFGMSVKLMDNGRERINLQYKDLSKSNTVAKLWYLLAPFYEDQIISSGFGALSMQRAFDDDEIEIGVLSQLRTLLQANFAADQSLAFSSDTQTQGKNCEVLRRQSLAALQGLEPKTSRFREPMQPISSGSFTISDPSSMGQLVIEIPNLGLRMTPINPDSFPLRLPEAAAYCQNLQWAGLNAWRLPNSAELRSLRDLHPEQYLAHSSIGLESGKSLWAAATRGGNEAIVSWALGSNFDIATPKPQNLADFICVR